eukprot:17933_1
MAQLNSNDKPLQLNWQSHSSTSITTHPPNNESTNQNTIKFFPNNSKPNTNQTQSIKADNILNHNSTKWNQFKFTFNETNPFTFDFKENENKNENTNNNNNNNNSFNFSVSNLSIALNPSTKSKRKIKFPEFSKMTALNDDISLLQTEINTLKKHNICGVVSIGYYQEWWQFRKDPIHYLLNIEDSPYVFITDYFC